MLEQTAQQRNAFTVSPLLVIGVIFLALLVIEALLVARFWLQLATANTPDGINALILEVSQPLVAPFADAQASAQEVGSFERKTLLAAMAYLVGAVVLALVTMVASSLLTGNEALLRRKRRSSLAHFEHPLIDHSGARLVGTAALSLTPEQATRALKMMGLDRLDTQVFVIPAAGGCIVAAFAAPAGTDAQVPLIGRISATREAMAVRRALRQIETRFQPREVQAGVAQ